MTANFSDLGSFVKAFISARICSEVNISLICQSVYYAVLVCFKADSCTTFTKLTPRVAAGCGTVVAMPDWKKCGDGVAKRGRERFPAEEQAPIGSRTGETCGARKTNAPHPL
jgi:hypothetical protein